MAGIDALELATRTGKVMRNFWDGMMTLACNPMTAVPHTTWIQQARGQVLGRLRADITRACRETLAPVSLYLLVAAAMLAPLSFPQMPSSPGHDLANHVSGIIEATNALNEGQFPIRVAPHQNENTRYPVFQYYGNFPYLAGALLSWCHVSNSPYLSYKLVLLLGMALGGLFVQRCAWFFSRQALASCLGGVVFTTAPYMLTDIHGRFAYTECVSFSLLPVVCYFTLRSYYSRSLRYPLCGAVAWSLLGLSHNITYLYASLFFALFLATLPRSRNPLWLALGRAGACHLAGFLLNAWYFVPQYRSLPLLNISGSLTSVMASTWLTPLGVLLAPTLVLPSPFPEPLDNARIGLQCGWPILAAFGVASYFALQRVYPPVPRSSLVRFLALFVVAFFLVWSPVDFWQYLPGPFAFVQFTYRLLMFVVLFGSILAGLGLACAFPRGLGAARFAAGVVALGFLASPYLGYHPATHEVTVLGEYLQPNMGRCGCNLNFRLAASGPVDTWRPRVQSGNLTVLPLDQTRAATQHGEPSIYIHDRPFAAIVQLPVLYYPGFLQVEDNGVRRSYGSLDGYVAVQLPPGQHVVKVSFVGSRTWNWVSALAWLALLTLLPLALLSAYAQRLRRRLDKAMAVSSRLAGSAPPGLAA